MLILFQVEFEESIKEDLALIGVKGDVVTHTSDYFEEMLVHAQNLINKGLAYVDDTDQETVPSFFFKPVFLSSLICHCRCAPKEWTVLNRQDAAEQ
jgi:hypothetical protein